MTDPLGQSQVLPYLTGLSEKGFQIHILSFEKQARYQAQSELIRSICDKHKISWTPLLYTKNPPVLSGLYDYNRMKNTAVSLYKKHKFKLIHCRSYLPALAGLHLKNKFQVPLLFDMRGFWVDERIEGKIWNLTNPVYRFIYNFFKKKEKILFQQSDAIVSLTKRAVPEIQKIQGKISDKKPIYVIPCCADIQHFNPSNISSAETQKRKSILNIPPENFILVYLGGIGTWYMANEMLQFYKILLKEIPASTFVFITTEPEEMINSIAKKYNIPLNNIRVFPSLRNDIPAWLSIADYSIFFIRPTYSKQASSPTKQGEIMSMGIPVICNTGIGDTDGIIENSSAGITCETLNDESFYGIVHKIKNMKFDRQQICKSAEEYFSLEKGINQYFKIYQELIKNDDKVRSSK